MQDLPPHRARSGSGGGDDDATVFDALRRQPLQQLQRLLEDAGLPTYGSKDVLLRRITGELATARQAQQGAGAAVAAAPPPQQAEWGPGATWRGAWEERGDGSGGGERLEQQEVTGPPVEGGTEGHQQQQPLQSGSPAAAEAAAAASHPAHARVAAAAAARRALLEALVDVREVCGWLVAARADDLCVIDVR